MEKNEGECEIVYLCSGASRYWNVTTMHPILQLNSLQNVSIVGSVSNTNAPPGMYTYNIFVKYATHTKEREKEKEEVERRNNRKRKITRTVNTRPSLFTSLSFIPKLKMDHSPEDYIHAPKF
jgi:hypothetical protein